MAKKAAPMTTAKCKARKCPDLILIPGYFGYRCRHTGDPPRFHPCQKEGILEDIR